VDPFLGGRPSEPGDLMFLGALGKVASACRDEGNVEAAREHFRQLRTLLILPTPSVRPIRALRPQPPNLRPSLATGCMTRRGCSRTGREALRLSCRRAASLLPSASGDFPERGNQVIGIVSINPE
jgi:hypothetical protein